MDDTSMRLPIRLVPRRNGLVVICVSLGFFLALGVVTMVPLLREVWSPDMQGLVFDGFPYVLTAVLGTLCLAMLAVLSYAALSLLPHGRMFALDIASDAVTRHGLWGAKRFAWSDISSFMTTSRLISRRRYEPETLQWFVVALRAGDSVASAVRDDLYKRSVLQIGVGGYTGAEGEFAAYSLAEWLNGLQAQAKAQPGGIVETIVPMDFKAVATTNSPPARRASREIKRSQVIER